MPKDELKNDRRLRFIAIFFIAIFFFILSKLFILQVLEHEYYQTFVLNTREIYKQLHPSRGNIYFQDTRNGEKYPAAINRQYYLLYAVPKDIPSENVTSTVDSLLSVIGEKDNDRNLLIQKLSKPDDQYEPISKKIEAATAEKIRSLNLKGVSFTPYDYRYYPENNLASNVLGFCRQKDNLQELVGNYGLESYWNKTLSGRPGFFAGARTAVGGLIALAKTNSSDAQNGSDLILTIDRNIEYQACSLLKKGLDEYQAKSASLVMMNPETGAVIAMCSLPDFDPNDYSNTKNINNFNNTAVFAPYEPGSVFKPIIMSAAVDLGLVSPNTTFVDPCSRTINNFTIHNALDKCYGTQTMTQVLENSINTGMVWISEKMGKEEFRKYVKNYGFGQKTNVGLAAENAGNISSLDLNRDIYTAVGSFGQGLTATPLQIAAAYSAIANHGILPTPYIVAKIENSDGSKKITEPDVSRRVISDRTAKLTAGMLTSVVENHYSIAKIPGYFVAGKTGTAQIAENGKYSDDRTNHTFAGFAPATNPKIVLVVKYEEPQRKWAEQTALNTFRDALKFALSYYNIPNDR